jgi:hypothetical protein
MTNHSECNSLLFNFDDKTKKNERTNPKEKDKSTVK